ncbi:MAG: ABC transporter permease [Acidimicrobiia bacterium]
MLQYVIAGLVLGGIYAIAAAGLVVTYVSAGILNFAFGSLAFFVARMYYFLHVQHKWDILPSAIVSIVIVGPGLGVLLYALLFRHLRLKPQLIKVVATIGLSVTIPPICDMLFGKPAIIQAPGLAPEPVKVYTFLDVPVDMNQIIVYICVVLTMLIGFLILRYTDIGLCVRAMVDSEAMTALSGTSPARVSIGVWAVSTFFAGLAGVLAAPKIGLGAAEFTTLVAAAFAAVIAAKFRNLPMAIGVGLAMGIAGALVQKYMDVGSSLTAAVIPSIPFGFILIFLVYHTVRGGRVSETDGIGGALDRAIQPNAGAHTAEDAAHLDRPRGWFDRNVSPMFITVVMLVLPLILKGFWVGLVGQAAAFAVVFLSFTLVTGEGGMIWLCQITFAGVGAMTTAQLATVHGWPVLSAIVVGALIAAAMGTIIGFLTIRLGNLYVALVTLTFGLLMEKLVFTRDTFYKFGVGVRVPRPEFAQSPKALTYLFIGIFCVLALLITNLRRSTTGLAMSAVRWSEPAARTIGLSVVQMKMLVSGLAAFCAGLGGGMLSIHDKQALPDAYLTLIGLVWLAVLVTNGVRSNVAAQLAGLTFTMMPALFTRFLSNPLDGKLLQLPPALFGLGAIFVARNPEGVVAQNARAFRQLFRAIGGKKHRGGAPAVAAAAAGGGSAPVDVTDKQKSGV